MMTNTIPSIIILDNTQCFPRYKYNAHHNDDNSQDLPGLSVQFDREDAITDEALTRFQVAFPIETIVKDDLFYYTYGILHSKDYRSRYSDTLSKQLPGLPVVESAKKFWTFVKAGRALGSLHVGFETWDNWPGVTVLVEPDLARTVDNVTVYHVEQMKFFGRRPHSDKTTIIYNSKVKITGIPLEAYGCVVNGRSAIEWVMERQCVSTDKASGIVNDANDYANETMGDPEYPLKLLLSVITVSMKTLEIVQGLPALDIMPVDGGVSDGALDDLLVS